jgi:hypothetical protein
MALLALVCVGSVLAMHGFDVHAGLLHSTAAQHSGIDHHPGPDNHSSHHSSPQGDPQGQGTPAPDGAAPVHSAHVGALCAAVVLTALAITGDDRRPQRLALPRSSSVAQATPMVDPPVPRLGLVVP